jgi:glycosyltransferase involved in cell wall biosynthesis
MHIKKVLVNATMYTGQRNGYGSYISEVSRRLENKDQIEYIIYSFKKIESLSVKNITVPYGLLQRIISLGNISLYRIIWNFWNLTFISRKYDVLLGLTPHGTLFHNNQIIQIMDLISFEYPYNKLQYYYYKTFLPLLINRSKSVITLSRYSKLEIQRYFHTSAKKIVPIYCGIDHLSQSDQLNKPGADLIENDFFLMVGVGMPHKNAMLMLNAYKEGNIKTKLVVVTNITRHSEELIRFSKKYLGDRVIFFHNLPASELNWLYKNTKAHFYLSLKEGFGLPPFEALNYNTVTVVTKSSCLPEIYEDSVIYADSISVSGLFDVISKIESDQYNFEDILTKGKKRSAKFLWSDTVSQIESLCLRI